MHHSQVIYKISGWLDIPLMMLFPSQGALLGFWIALGGKHASWRVLLTVGGIVAYLWCVGTVPYVEALWHGLLLVPSICIVSVLLLLARFTGLRIFRGEASSQQRPQFAVRDALVWLTAFAVLFGAIRWWRSWPLHNILDDPADVRSLTNLGICAIASLASLWVVLGRRRLILRIFALVAVNAAASYSFTQTNPWLGSLYLASEVAWIVGSLVVVRLAGYRLTWQWRLGRAVDVSRPPDTAAT
jgi:hypothetical protein